MAMPVSGASYFVSPSGYDDNNGLDSTTAWLSIDKGDRDGLLIPGDTINVLPGRYNVTQEIILTTSGTSNQNITYRQFGTEPAILDADKDFNNLLIVEGNHIVINGLELVNSKDDGITIKGDSCLVDECYVHDCDRVGIRVEGKGVTLLRNIVADIKDHGLNIRDGADDCKIYNNTIYSCGKNGIETPSKFVRIFNNIIVDIEKGINGKTENICGFNDIWNHSSDAYAGGAVDSAGGISEDPLFIDATSGNFVPMVGSPVIDAGYDIGYAYSKASPDMGAIEKHNIYYIDPAGNDGFDGLSPATAWASIDNGNLRLVPGDTVKILPGIYADSIQITSGGIAGDEIVFAGDSNATIIDGSEFTKALQINADYVVWSGTKIANASKDNISISGSYVSIEFCQIDSAGQNGINVLSGGHTLIYRNSFSENHLSDILLAADSNQIINNTFCLSGTNVINALSSSYNELINCILNGEDGSNLAVRADATTILTYCNIFSYNTPIQGGAVLGEGCIETDPLLIDYIAGNFHLSSISLAIDAGNDIGMPFYGSAPDMGAYETSTLVSLSVTPTYDSLIADSTYQFDVIALGDDGYPAAPGTLSWVHTFATGEIDSNGLYLPQLIGSGTIEVTSDIGGIAGVSEMMTVVPGSLDSLYITPNRDTISADSMRQFMTLGYDIYGNVVSDPGELIWDVQQDIGIIDGAGLFDATKADWGFIKVSGDNDLHAITDTIVVLPGQIASIQVEPENNVAEDGSSYQYSANGFDSDSNLVADLTDSVTWSTDDPTGTMTTAGLYTAGSDLSPPAYLVTALYNGAISDFGEVTVTSSGALAYILVETENGSSFGDTSLTTDNDTSKIYCRGYDSDDSLLGDVSVDWYIIGDDSIGTVEQGPDAQTTLTLRRLGTGKVVAVHGSGLEDTTGVITSTAGLPSVLVVSPEGVTISADSSIQFEVISLDADGNDSDPVVVPTWEVLGDVGSIDGSGLFIPTTVGTGYVVASGAGLADTVGAIDVIPGELQMLTISPDTAVVGIGESITFSTDSYDADGNIADRGELTWLVLGKIGEIDSTGVFTSSTPGVCSLMATSSINGVNDISGVISVEALIISEALQGNTYTYAGQKRVPLLAFTVENACPGDKVITGIGVQEASQGSGNLTQRLTNTDSIGLYYDIDDDLILTPADSLIASAVTDAEVTEFTFSPLVIPSGAVYTLMVGGNISSFPHKGDRLDYFIVPTTDFATADETPIAGPDTVNSYGFGIIDGMVAGQLTLTPTGLTEINPDGLLHNVLILDIPRNGYENDILKMFSVANEGSAGDSDIDSLIIFRDNGNLLWDGPGGEIRIGQLIHTGGRWTLSGLSVGLTDPTTRFFVAAQLSEYPSNGATVALTIPQNGLEMASNNDGPYDAATVPVDTIVIESSEAVYIRILPVPSRELIPGEQTSTLTALELINGRMVAAGLDSLRVKLYAADPLGATQDQLDSQIDSLFVYLKGDGDYTGIGVNDSLLAVASLAGGEVLFETNGLSIPGSGSNIILAITAGMNIQNAKNGNTINVGPAEAGSVYLDATVVSGTFPLINDQSHTINAFPSSLIKVNPVEGETLFGGQSGHIVFDFELPSDGYSSGTLTKLNFQNIGTINGSEALERVKVWADLTGDGLSNDDQLLGNAIYNEGLWTLEGISRPLSAVSNRFIVTVDVSDLQFVGGTLQFQIPVEGVWMWTGTNGPDDQPVGNGEAHLIFPANRVTAISIPVASLAASPGSPGNLIFTCALYNGYTNKSQLLQTIILSNISRSASDLAYADHELGRVSLYLDADHDRIFANDSMVAVGQFVDGSLQMTGLDIALEPEKLNYFFVLADIPLDAIDSDSLAVSIASPASLVFADPVNINGDLPLTSGGYIIVDGSVRDQYKAIETPPRTLSPGDTSIVLFSFRPAANGDQIDKLNSVTLTNVEDADTGDVAIMELWLDLNGDDLWQNTDSLIGPFVYAGTDWRIDNLDLEITSSPPVLFAVGDISDSVAPNARFRAQLPVNGCIYESENDGPRDFPVTAINTFTMSYSALRVDFLPLSEHYSIGQTIEVKLTVTNLSDLQVMDNVYGLIVSDNPSTISLTDSVALPQTLMPGESVDFTYYYTADAVGTVSWHLQAIAPAIYDSSAVVQTNPANIQITAGSVGLQLITSIPASVTRGQNNIFPLGINITHPDSSADAASLRLDSLNLAIADGSGVALRADNVFSRLLFTSGLGPLALFDEVPALSTLPVVFDEPVIIEPGETTVISLLINIDSAATATDFKLSIPNVEAIPIVDGNTLLPISIDPGVVFPLETSTCQIDIPSREMVIASSSPHSGRANYGQENIDVMHLLVRHPGELGSSQIQLSGFALNVVNDSNRVIIASDILNKISVVHQSTVIGGLSSNDLESANLNIQLNSPLTISPGEIDSIALCVSIRDDAGHAGFGLTIADSSALEVRDLSSGTPLVVATDTLLSSESVFPMTSAPIMLTYPAQSPDLCLSSTMTATVVGGTDAFDLLELSLVYPAGVDYSPVQMDDILVSVLDTLGRPLDPNRLFDRIGVSLSGGPILYQSYVRLQDGAIAFEIGTDGLVLSPGDSVSINLIGDIETDVPYDHFVLHIQNEDAIDICDITDTASHPGFTAVPDCVPIYPYTSAPTMIFLPAGRPDIVYDGQPVKIGYPGQQGLDIYTSNWTYEASIPLGDLSVQAMHGRILKRTEEGLVPVAGSEIFEAVYLWFDDLLVAADTALSANNLEMTLEDEFIYSRGAGLDMRLTCDIKSNAPRGNYVISFTDSTFMEIIDRNLAAAVYPKISGESYPIYTAEISLSAARLDSSFTNYPNPFQPSHNEATTIGFVLLEDAWVDIELFDITGEAVKSVTLNSFRTAGSHQTDRWTGHNDAGLEVLPGTYYCRIKVKYVSGGEEIYRRKIAVIR